MAMHINYRINGYFFRKKINLEEKNSIILEINEYDELDLSIVYDESDNIQRIQIETYSGMINLNNNEEVKVNPKGSLEDALVCGFYELIITTQHRTNFSFFLKVSPKNMEENHLLLLKEYLDKYRKGLFFNYFDKTNIGNEFANENFFMNVYTLKRDWKDIYPFLDSILRSPYYEIEKKYETSMQTKKQDAHTIRKNQKYSTTNNLILNKTKNKTYDNYENKCLLLYLEKYLYLVKHTKKSILSNLKNLKDSINNDTLVRDEKRLNFNKIKRDYSIDFEWKKKSETEIYVLEKQISVNVKKLSSLITIEKELQSMEFKIIQCIENIRGLLKTNFIKQKQGKLKDHRYIEVIAKLKTINSTGAIQSTKLNKQGYAMKKSEILFEYFCLFRIINGLNEIGFVLKETSEDIYFLNEIKSESTFELFKDDLKIVLMYDKEVPPIEDCMDKSETLYCTTLGPRRPDYTLLLYKDNIFQKAIVLDAKYRKTKYLYKNGERTQVQNTMMHYRLFEYKGLDVYDSRNCVKKVIALYPKQKNKITNNNFEQLEFIPIDISSNEIEEMLKKELSLFVDVIEV